MQAYNTLEMIRLMLVQWTSHGEVMQLNIAAAINGS